VSILCKKGFSTFWHKSKKILTRRFKSEYEIWMDHNYLLTSDIHNIREQIRKFKYKPKISIIMPVYNVEKNWLKKAVNSVFDQIYTNWELCIVDDASTKKHIKRVLSKYRDNKKVKIKFLKRNLGISAASNEALALTEGEFVGFLDDDDELSIDALFEVIKVLNKNPNQDLIYSDEDKINLNKKRVQPFFKPDYSPDLLLSYNYICHFLVCRKKIVSDIKGFREGVEGSQDYDLLLRLTEKTDKIFHIPKILYHWRQIKGSTSVNHKAKGEHINNSIKALHQALKRRGIEGTVEKGINFDQFESYRVKRKIKQNPLVSIIIPIKDKISFLKRCLKSIEEKTDYKNYEIIIVDNRSVKKETHDFLSVLSKKDYIRVVKYDYEYNFSKINNSAVGLAKGSHLLFLNNDIKVISKEWLSSMLEHSMRDEVGAVGAKLLYPDNTIQHAGTIIGLGGVAAHSHKNFPVTSNGYFGSLNTIRNYSAVTADCMMIRKRVFEEVGGFDEKNLPIGFNDVDLCLEIRKRGYLIVYTPYATLYHYESQTRSNNLNPDEVMFMKKKWGDTLLSDSYYNPNLSLESEDFKIKTY
jgi:GT2 family glycosyltransferase